MHTLPPTRDTHRSATCLPKALLASLAMAGYLLTPSLSADTTVNLTPHTNDNNVNDSGSGQWYGDSTVRIGRRSNDGKNYDYVMPFELPDLQGDVVKSALLTVSIPSGSYGAAGLGDVDLYGSSLYSSSSAVSNSAYYAGASNPLNPDATLLQDDLIDTADHVNNGYGSVTSVDISSHIQSLYNAGAQPGDYTFLMLSLDVFPGGDYKYLVVDTANGSPKPDLELVIGPDTVIETVTSSTTDRVIRNTGAGDWDGATSVRIGRRNTDGQSYAFVMPFALPDLQGGAVTNAELTVNFPTGSWDAVNLGDVDLYGIKTTSASNAANVAGYYVDGSNPTNTDAVLINDNFADTSDIVSGGYGPATSGDLSSFIQARYNAGAQPGDYVFLVLTLDQHPNNNYRYLEANTGNSGSKPTLVLTIGDSPLPPGIYCDPVNGDINNDGSSSAPWPGLQAVRDAGKPIPSGDTVWLMNGYHGEINLSGHKTSPTTIAALEGHSPTMKRVHFTNASNWILDGLEISPEFTGNVDRPNLVNIHPTCHDITVRNCLMYSAADASSWTAGDWASYASKGIQIDGPNCVIENNTILNTGFSIVVRGSSPNTYVGYNTIDGFSGDGLRGLADDCVFEYNLVQNAKDIGNGNHDDGFQSWTGDSSNNDGVVSDIVLRGNVFISYTDGSDPLISEMQGIGCFDGFFEDWIVENNVVITDMWHGLSLYGAINCQIINNTVVDNPEVGYTHRPWIGIFAHKNGTPSSGNVVRNNLARSITGATSSAGTVDNNITTTAYTDHFVDYANFDVHLKSTSTAIDAGSSTLAPALDYEGDTRDSNPDIGADEY